MAFKDPEREKAYKKDYRVRRKAERSDYERQRRVNPAHRANYIVQDSRSGDKRHGRSNDLTVAFVERLIASGCAYCGETKLQMTLDRIDNSIGHLMTNVVSACVRCNLMRRDMPYAAWYSMLPAIRFARESGLFGEWRGGIW
jgi:hypothetical protein